MKCSAIHQTGCSKITSGLRNLEKMPFLRLYAMPEPRIQELNYSKFDKLRTATISLQSYNSINEYGAEAINNKSNALYSTVKQYIEDGQFCIDGCVSLIEYTTRRSPRRRWIPGSFLSWYRSYNLSRKSSAVCRSRS